MKSPIKELRIRRSVKALRKALKDRCPRCAVHGDNDHRPCFEPDCACWCSYVPGYRA